MSNEPVKRLKIKISLLDENDNELDYICRIIPTWAHYNVINGLLNDLFLLIRRNIYVNLASYVLKQWNHTVLYRKDK